MRAKPEAWKSYVYGTIAVVIVSAISLVGAATIPFVKKKGFGTVMVFFMALAVGTMCGDALLHLIPEALGLHGHGGGEPEPLKDAIAHDPHVAPGLSNNSDLNHDFDDDMSDEHTAATDHSEDGDHQGHSHDGRRRRRSDEREEHGSHEEAGGGDDHGHEEEGDPKAVVYKLLVAMMTIYALFLFESLTRLFQLRFGRNVGHGHSHGGGTNETKVAPKKSNPPQPFATEGDKIRKFNGSNGTNAYPVDGHGGPDITISKPATTVTSISLDSGEVTVSNGVNHDQDNHECAQFDHRGECVDYWHHLDSKLDPNERRAPSERRVSSAHLTDGSEIQMFEYKHGHKQSIISIENMAANEKRICGLKTVAFMVLFGDALHNFADGMVLGAAFYENIIIGVSTTIAVACHELPHELGDFAVLIQSGLSVKAALILNGVSALTAVIGLYIGIAVSASIDGLTVWIFAIVAGMFLYISLVGMLTEIKEMEPEKTIGGFVAVNLGILIGVAILLCLALFEEDMIAWGK